MGHNLDITDGQTSFVSARLDAWHMLGTTLDADAITAEEAMEVGRLGSWNVRKVALTAEVDGQTILMPDRFGVVRDNPVVPGRIDPLGVVGNYHHIIQNEEHADFLNLLVDQSGATFDTAGALNGGKQVFITMKLPEGIAVGGEDLIDYNIAAINSHDGSMAFTVMLTPVRIVCQNTLNLALGDTKNIIRVRHTSGATKGLVSTVRNVLDITFKYQQEFDSIAEQMVNATLTQSRFEEIITKEFGAGDNPTSWGEKRAERRIGEMMDLFITAGTQDAIRDTVWAGFNALTEWADHVQPANGDRKEQTRASRTILDTSFKVKARDVMMAQMV